LIRIIADDDRSLLAPSPDLDNEQLVELLREMTKARVCSTRLFNLQRQGRIGTFAPIDGQEAAVVGSAAALDPARDWVVPQYREQVALGRFGPEVLEREVLYLRGHPEGGFMPESAHVFPVQIALAAQVPHAVGLAWGLHKRGEEAVVLVHFGDGASSEGDFYEAANFAGVLRAPVILFCNNNGWAISTPRSIQTASESIAMKAAAFGFPGVQVDGTDVLAVYSVAREARERALAGQGPTLIESVSYRLGPHTTADDPTRYVPPDEVTRGRARDPILRFRRLLEARGLWDEADQEAAEKSANDLMNHAIEAAESMPLAPDAFFDHVYAVPTPRMETQRAELRRRLRQPEAPQLATGPPATRQAEA
jgi:pyruvate dehydrogenase E1 component subunit alpha